MRWIALLAFAAVCALPSVAAAAAAPALPFDPEAATRAWIDTMGPEATERSNTYFTGNYFWELIGSLVNIGIALALLLTGVMRGVRGWLERTLRFYPLYVFASALFYLVVSTALTFPLAYYLGFVREHAFDLSTQTFAEWFSEYLIGVALTLVLGSIFITILYAIIAVAKKSWWIWGALVTVVLSAALSMAVPVFIAPLFNTYTSMEDGPLKQDILAFAQANGVPAHDVMVYDRSRQTNSISANVSGFGATTRISLADTLLERGSPGAVRAVMGHEIGHYVLGHIYSLLIMSSLVIIITFAFVHFCFVALAKNERWGIRSIADPAGLPLIVVLIGVIGLFTAPMQRNMIRFHEQQADMFGLNAAREPDGFAEASVMLSEYRKMEPSAAEEWFFYDHPSGWTRIHGAMVWKANEIAAGRLDFTPGGPPEGWRPDFVRDREAAPAATPTPEPSPAAPSN